MQAWLVSEHSSRGLDPETLSGIFANAQVPQGPRSGKTFGKKNLIAFRKGLPKRPLSLSLQPADHSHPRLDSRFCRPLSLSLSLSGGARVRLVSRRCPEKTGNSVVGSPLKVRFSFFLFPFSGRQLDRGDRLRLRGPLGGVTRVHTGVGNVLRQSENGRKRVNMVQSQSWALLGSFRSWVPCRCA